MTRIRQNGILDISEDEFKTLIDIFDRFPDSIMLTSTYMAIKMGVLEVTIPDAVIAEFIRMFQLPETPPRERLLIDKILEFRSRVELTIK